MMFFVDETLINSKLDFYDDQLQCLTELHTLNTKIEEKAVERMAHLMIESIIDVGNALIDGFIMRDPGSYEDIIDILEDEKVITNEVAPTFREFVKYRKPLVRDFTEVDVQEVFQFIKEKRDYLSGLSLAVREYLGSQKHTYNTFIKK